MGLRSLITRGKNFIRTTKESLGLMKSYDDFVKMVKTDLNQYDVLQPQVIDSSVEKLKKDWDINVYNTLQTVAEHQEKSIRLQIDDDAISTAKTSAASLNTLLKAEIQATTDQLNVQADLIKENVKQQQEPLKTSGHSQTAYENLIRAQEKDREALTTLHTEQKSRIEQQLKDNEKTLQEVYGTEGVEAAKKDLFKQLDALQNAQLASLDACYLELKAEQSKIMGVSNYADNAYNKYLLTGEMPAKDAGNVSIGKQGADKFQAVSTNHYKTRRGTDITAAKDKDGKTLSLQINLQKGSRSWKHVQKDIKDYLHVMRQQIYGPPEDPGWHKITIPSMIKPPKTYIDPDVAAEMWAGARMMGWEEKNIAGYKPTTQARERLAQLQQEAQNEVTRLSNETTIDKTRGSELARTVKIEEAMRKTEIQIQTLENMTESLDANEMTKNLNTISKNNNAPKNATAEMEAYLLRERRALILLKNLITERSQLKADLNAQQAYQNQANLKNQVNSTSLTTNQKEEAIDNVFSSLASDAAVTAKSVKTADLHDQNLPLIIENNQKRLADLDTKIDEQMNRIFKNHNEELEVEVEGMEEQVAGLKDLHKANQKLLESSPLKEKFEKYVEQQATQPLTNTISS